MNINESVTKAMFNMCKVYLQREGIEIIAEDTITFAMNKIDNEIYTGSFYSGLFYGFILSDGFRIEDVPDELDDKELLNMVLKLI